MAEHSGPRLLDARQHEVDALVGLGRLEVDDEGHAVDVVVQGRHAVGLTGDVLQAPVMMTS